ncbi:hypothetical protein [Micromonospora sp. NPDC005324]|uniref:hypothetical protein n=1 Tax=Micromonospora sp. NPDC005324 TaxID=3157033 RepID=UPI0033A685B0
MTLLQECNRALGPEVVAAMADRLRKVSRTGSSVPDLAPELAEISQRYAELGGFDALTANATSSYSVRRRPRPA